MLANAAMTWQKNRPAAVVVSILSVIDRRLIVSVRPIPLFSGYEQGQH